ncbi:MAG: DNA translocase FtsK [Candidatus Pacebacteria bacterium]|nr:DNA translocase FtsK [Candidatus Paceibacterota bacterium]
MGILVMFSFTGQGQILLILNSFLIEKIGLGTLFLPFVFISSGLIMFQTKWAWSKPHILLGTLFLMSGVVGVTKSGSIGVQTFTNLSSLISVAGTYVFFIAFIISGALIVSQFSIGEVLEMISSWLSPKNNEKNGKQQNIEEEIEKAKGFRIPKLSLSMPSKKNNDFKVNENKYEEDIVVEKGGTAVVTSKSSKPVDADDLDSTKSSTNAGPMIWEFPPLSLLSPQGGGEADRGDVKKNADIIEHTLESFGIMAKVKEVNYGPSVTQYALDITRGTKLSRITGLSTDLALALAAPTGQVRIEAPIAGRSLVGIEVANQSAQYVTLRKMLASPKMKSHKSKLAVALGIDVAGQPVVADIAKMPHVLIAGATGSGKSVCVNTFLCSILFRSSPSEVKFILVDPKRVELTAYNNIPHLMTPVIVDPKKVVSALKWAANEMDNRYKKLAEVGVKNIESYNDLAGFVAMSSIVIVIDELADIMLFSPKEVEDSITRIAQMARAVGIHLVLATQRPSVDVITGLIKANVPTRIAFNVSSMMDSRVILDSPGAEKMLGKGDMLYVPPDQAKPSRVQGTFVSDQEIKSLVDFIKSQGEAPEYSEEITEKFDANIVSGGSSGTDGEDRDSKFDEAVQLISQYDKASSSMIQRRLSVGYARAARILDQLFEAGMVSEADGSKPREVNMTVIRDYLAGGSQS